MSEQSHYHRFLEPVYLNEKMVLNCAAYLFGGIKVETESTDKSDQSRDTSASLGLSFLNNLIQSPNIDMGARAGQSQESRSAYRYTVGGLHMTVLDDLKAKKMIHEGSHKGPITSVGTGEAYVDMHAELRPSDYYSLIGTVKILGPLLAQLFRDFGEKLLPAAQPSKNNRSSIVRSVESYEQSVASLIEKLESDYLTSKQLEMIMYPIHGNGRSYGIVDLDVTDLDPNELRSRLSGGQYHIIGKIIGRVESGDSFDLLQKTILSNSAEFLQKLYSFESDVEKIEAFRSQVSAFRQLAQQFVQLEIPGPAIRIAAMSVCM